jgi:molybdate/tungstate transport system substrate-binding protein
MVYGVTIPRNAPNPKLAKRFMLYLMNRDKGLKIMAQMGQPTVVPAVCDAYDKLPVEFRQYAIKKK